MRATFKAAFAVRRTAWWWLRPGGKWTFSVQALEQAEPHLR
jgi:hypothetical protein